MECGGGSSILLYVRDGEKHINLENILSLSSRMCVMSKSGLSHCDRVSVV